MPDAVGSSVYAVYDNDSNGFLSDGVRWTPSSAQADTFKSKQEALAAGKRAGGKDLDAVQGSKASLYDDFRMKGLKHIGKTSTGGDRYKVLKHQKVRIDQLKPGDWFVEPGGGHMQLQDVRPAKDPARRQNELELKLHGRWLYYGKDEMVTKLDQ